MKLNKFQHLVYDIVISILAIVAVILVIIDLSSGLNSWQQSLDYTILTIFFLDYSIRFCNAPDKKKFFYHNICDLIAIVPFHTFFRAFKVFRFSRFLKFAKLPRLFSFLYRPFRKAKFFFNINGFKYVIFVTTLLICIGGVLIHFAEGMSMSDGVWWAFVTATTVGYGDISPHTLYGRLIAMVLMLVGIGLIGTLTSTLTSYFLKLHQKNVSGEILDSIKQQLDDFSSLSEEDVEDICRILKALKSKDK